MKYLYDVLDTDTGERVVESGTAVDVESAIGIEKRRIATPDRHVCTWEDRVRRMKVLVACEESQTVCKAFRDLGHEAYSCDIKKPSGGHPEWHILNDALKTLEGGAVVTMDGRVHNVGKWDMLIAHPPCTYLSNVATRAFSLKCTEPEKVAERWRERAYGAVFFMHFVLAHIDKICVENPVGFVNYPSPKGNGLVTA